jgi:hypothetical protein
MFRRALRGAFLAAGFFAARCCRSSGVEHSLGKGEVECSNHSGSTILSQKLNGHLKTGVLGLWLQERSTHAQQGSVVPLT